MKSLIQIMLLSCEKASNLIEKEIYTGLNAQEKMQLFLHTRMCDTCKNWQKQSRELDANLQQHISLFPTGTGLVDEMLSEDAKQKLIDDLSKEAGE